MPEIIDVSADKVIQSSRKSRIELTAAQVVDLLGLVIDNPRLVNGQRDALQGFSTDFYKEHWDQGRNFCVRQGMGGVRDIVGWHWRRSADREDSLRALNEGLSQIPDTGLVIIDRERFMQGKIPRALQYGLGIDGEERIKQVLERLNGGSSIAFMTVGGELPPSIAQPLHTLIDHSGGAANSVIGDFEAGKPIEEILRRFKAQDHEMIREAYRQLNIGTRKLVHFKLLGNQHDDENQQLQKSVNDALDKYVDRPYAVWRYKDSAYRGDYNWAKCAFGLSLIVAVALSATGLESSGNPFIEGIKRVIPTLAADLSMNTAAAMSFVKDNQDVGSRLSDLGKVLWSKYRYPIAAGVAGGLVFGEGSEYLYQFFNGGYLNFPSGLMLALAAIIPTYLTTKVTKQAYKGAGTEDEFKSHPVQNTMMDASISSALITSLLGPLGLFNNPLAITAATEGWEPVWMMFSAKNNLSRYQREYLDKLSGNPITIFQETITRYRQP